MARDRLISRRGLITGFSSGAAALALSACNPFDKLSVTPWSRGTLDTDDDINKAVQRFLSAPTSMAREFPASEISRAFRANGSTDPDAPEYRALAANAFADWRLEIGGMVETPTQLSLADLRAMPARTQITRHDCVEGWSCIGKWTGVQLAAVLDRARLKPEARYIVFSCYDDLGKALGSPALYYESIDPEDAYHPQTILAYAMNDAPLPIPHGAPLRVRIERQLGYKMAKYIRRIDAVAVLPGKGGFWEDHGYDWYAGI